MALNNLQELMTITMEECGELTQVCSKMMRKFDNIDEITSKKLNAKTQRNKIIEEAGDVLCMLELLVENGLVEWEELEDRVQVKRNKLEKWSSLIKE
tara:strand:- start:2185 stop:2475 length:291 start_codon:yes stop_codon:yes gene_type:complete